MKLLSIIPLIKIYQKSSFQRLIYDQLLLKSRMEIFSWLAFSMLFTLTYVLLALLHPAKGTILLWIFNSLNLVGAIQSIYIGNRRCNLICFRFVKKHRKYQNLMIVGSWEETMKKIRAYEFQKQLGEWTKDRQSLDDLIRFVHSYSKPSITVNKLALAAIYITIVLALVYYLPNMNIYKFFLSFIFFSTILYFVLFSVFLVLDTINHRRNQVRGIIETLEHIRFDNIAASCAPLRGTDQSKIS